MSAWSDAVASLTAAPVAWHRLDETTGTVADNSTGGTDGAYAGTVTLGGSALVPGDTGGSIAVASGQANHVASGPQTTNATFTVAFTVSTTGVGHLWGTGGSGSRRAVIEIDPFGSGNVNVYYDGASFLWAGGSASLADGQPHLVIYRAQPGQQTLYVDGASVATASETPGATLSYQHYLGASYPSSAAAAPAGSFDEWLLFDAFLSDGDVALLWSGWQGSGPTTPQVDANLAGGGSLAVAMLPIGVTAGGLSGGGSLTAVASPVGGAMVAADLAGSGTFAALIDVPELPTGTDTANRVGGRMRSGYGIATWTPPVEATPAAHDGGHAYVHATAHGAVTMQGTQPTYTTSTASIPRARQRIIVGGKDVTYFRGVPTPPVEYQLAEPLLYGPATLTFPQIAAPLEQLGVGALKWLRPGATVKVQRVLDGAVVATDYKGVVIAFDTSGDDGPAGLRVEVGGEAQGRASLMERQIQIFELDRDLGNQAYFAIRTLGLPFTPRFGPTTGIRLSRFGGMGHLDYIHELVARAWTRNGNQWTIMPGDDGRYRMTRKDTTTIDFTVFADDKRTVAALRRDKAEEPNRIYATGVTPEGQRVRFGAYPGLKQSDPALYPFTDGRTFGEGTTDATTDTGDGIFVLLTRLWMLGYLSSDDRAGVYDESTTDAVSALQADAGLTETGTMTTATWDALFDLNVTGFSLQGSYIRPAAQRRSVRKNNLSPSGAIMGRNPDYDPHKLKVDWTVDMGAGLTRRRIREFSRAELKREKNWVGTITLATGAVLAGDVAVGATITAANVMDARDIRPGMNARLPQFDGGITVHVSGVSVTDDTVTLTVDTQARDAMKVWEVIQRNRETRRDPARRWMGNRSSTERKDSIDIWDEVGGVLDGKVTLDPGWNVVPVLAGQEGTVSRLRLELATAAEFACAVFGRKITPQRLNHLIADPLSTGGTEKWEKRATRKVLDDKILLYSAGTKDEPCGYSPGRKLNLEGTRSSHPLRGVHSDEAGFSYRCRVGMPVLWLAVYVPAANTLTGGRVLWNQLEAGV